MPLAWSILVWRYQCSSVLQSTQDVDSVTFGSTIRLRHIETGKYLAVNGHSTKHRLHLPVKHRTTNSDDSGVERFWQVLLIDAEAPSTSGDRQHSDDSSLFILEAQSASGVSKHPVMNGDSVILRSKVI